MLAPVTVLGPLFGRDDDVFAVGAPTPRCGSETAALLSQAGFGEADVRRPLTSGARCALAS